MKCSGTILLSLFIVLALFGGSAIGASARQATGKTPLVFTDADQQSRQFIGYSHTIRLTPEQQRMKERVLSRIPAPCCSNYSVLTCCCPCNLAKSVWGLSNHAIAHLGYDEQQLRSAVLGWLSFAGPRGFSGDSCYTGRCEQPFDRNGCGGMQESGLRAAS